MKLTDADNAADGIFFPALEQNMMGAVLINENDEVMFFNPAAEKLWGYKREEVIGNNIDMLIPRDLRPAHPEYIRHNREGGKARVEGMSRELQLEKKDGSKIWTRFALSKVSAEGKVYYLALVRDASVDDQWWYCAFPGAAILLTAVGFNLFGDGIRDLLDPKAGGKQS